MADIITRDIDSNLNIRVCQETCDTWDDVLLVSPLFAGN